jgi:hypothetical protein
MNSRFNVVVALLGLCAAPAVYAGAPCTLHSLSGTYAFYEKGSSTILDPTAPTYPLHWAGAIAPFIATGQITIGPNGTATGFFWIRIGSYNSGPDATPVQLTITELNEDCTGKWQFAFNLLGTLNTIEERFVVFDEGRQFRSIPTVTGVPAMAWIGEGHRISKIGEGHRDGKSDAFVDNCGPRTAKGTYLVPAENLVRLGQNPIFSDAALLRLDVSMDGDVEGILYEKMGPTGNIQLPVQGTITVNPDCSFAESLNVTVMGNPSTIPLRGVFFDEGKKLYAVNVNTKTMGTQYSFGQGERIGPGEERNSPK